MPIVIPEINNTNISSNVRRLDTGVSANTRSSAAAARLGRQITESSARIAAIQTDAEDKADYITGYSKVKNQLSESIAALQKPDENGNVKSKDKYNNDIVIPYEKAIETLLGQARDSVGDMPYSNNTKNNISNRLISDSPIYQSNARSSARAAKNVKVVKAGRDHANISANTLLNEPSSKLLLDKLANNSELYKLNRNVLGAKFAAKDSKESYKIIVKGYIDGLIRSKNTAEAKRFLTNDPVAKNLDESVRYNMMNRVKSSNKIDRAAYNRKVFGSVAVAAKLLNNGIDVNDIESAYASINKVVDSKGVPLKEKQASLTATLQLAELGKEVRYVTKGEPLDDKEVSKLLNETLDKHSTGNVNMDKLVGSEGEKLIAKFQASRLKQVIKDPVQFFKQNNEELAYLATRIDIDPASRSEYRAKLDSLYDSWGVSKPFRKYYDNEDINTMTGAITLALKTKNKELYADSVADIFDKAEQSGQNPSEVISEITSGTTITSLKDLDKFALISKDSINDVAMADVDPNLQSAYSSIPNSSNGYKYFVSQFKKLDEMKFINTMGDAGEGASNTAKLADSFGNYYKSLILEGKSDSKALDIIQEKINDNFIFTDSKYAVLPKSVARRFNDETFLKSFDRSLRTNDELINAIVINKGITNGNAPIGVLTEEIVNHSVVTTLPDFSGIEIKYDVGSDKSMSYNSLMTTDADGHKYGNGLTLTWEEMREYEDIYSKAKKPSSFFFWE